MAWKEVGRDMVGVALVVNGLPRLIEGEVRVMEGEARVAEGDARVRPGDARVAETGARVTMGLIVDLRAANEVDIASFLISAALSVTVSDAAGWQVGAGEAEGRCWEGESAAWVEGGGAEVEGTTPGAG